MENIIKPITIWDRNKYLNIWTIQFGGSDIGTLGYAQFPDLGPANTDGVVMSYDAFGRVGILQTNYNLGRTCTHEVGHWLDLKHIWGDENACADDDDVIDTPLQTVSSSGCNVFPTLESTNGGCSELYPGIMFMNYMDYGFHQCRRMYTFGQTARMDAALFNQRASLLTSPGCLPGSYKVVISQVYGGGGNSGAPYTNDYIELYNRGTVSQNLNGWSVQVASATGTSWFPVTLPNFTLQPGQYYLIQGINGANGVALPTADLTSTVSLSATAGKVILVNSTTLETTANPTGSQIIDKVGYGPTASGFEGTPTAALSNTTVALRNSGGCTDTDNNINDFSVGAPTPRNSASSFGTCNSLSISQNTAVTVAIHPNPTSSKVYFDNSNFNFKEVTIYNYLGQEVAKTSFSNNINNQEIDMSNLATGVYVLKFSDGATSKSVKVVKQ